MEERIVRLFSNIKFYERYRDLSSRSRKSTARLESTDTKKIINIFDTLGYKVKYFSKENFYKIADSVDNWNFNVNFSLKYGLVEIIYGLKENGSKKGLGGTSSSICEDIAYYNKISNSELIKDPSFSDYESLKDILNEAMLIYEDFKQEVLSNLT